jgi:hypothetical protein
LAKKNVNLILIKILQMSAHEAGHIDDKSHEMEASGVFEEELSNPSDLKLSKNASKSK